MTTNSIIVRSSSVLAASLVTALLSASLLANEPLVIRGDQKPVYQERVSLTDLDLRQSDDRRVLKGRVRRAAKRVCREAEGPIPEVAFAGGPTCTSLTYKAARPQVTAAIQRARTGQQVAATLVMSTPAGKR